LRLFLYGTLQPASDTPMARWLMERIEDATAATMPGRLLGIPGASGWFPALVPGAAWDRCQGTVVRVMLGTGDLARLDRYEGREYRRTGTRVRLASGSLLTAAVYRWHAPAPARSLRIADGDFLTWLDRTGRRSFKTRLGAA
jgi:gamma-glutamylcyclotransferase (GGCT)/AIG2-like uncharacterized protein YtfP